MATFKVEDVKKASSSLPVANWEEVVTARCNRVKPESYSSILAGWVPVGGGHRGVPMNGFVEAVHLAYHNHYPLVLSPDAVWMCIAQGFARHINANAEKLRNLFVEHEGKKTLKVRRDDFVKGSPTNPWPEVFGEFSEQIRQHVGPKTHDLLTPSFSTTGPTERAAAQVVLMDTFKEYFTYMVRTLCGIPEVTLEGTVEDWKQLRDRAVGLAQFDLEWWIDALKPILDQFVAAASGHVDKKFWSTMYKWIGESGGPYITGWIVTLFPYLDDNRNGYLTSWNNEHIFEGVTTESIPSGVAATPFIWEYLGTEIPMHFYAGFMGASQNSSILAIRPEISWTVCDDKEIEKQSLQKRHPWFH